MKTYTDDEVRPFSTPWRSARLVRVIDADTLDVLIDVGFDVHVTARVRLLLSDLSGVDAYEVRGDERAKGIKASARASALIEGQHTDSLNNPELRILSRKGGHRGSFGRWLAAVLYRVEGGWCSLGDTLLEEGHAERWSG